MARVDEWVEVAGPSVDLAVDAALEELGLPSREHVKVEVIQEPTRGILGTGWRAQDAVVKVTPKPRDQKRRRRRGRKRRSDRGVADTGDGRAGADDNRGENGKGAGQRRSEGRSKSGSRDRTTGDRTAKGGRTKPAESKRQGREGGQKNARKRPGRSREGEKKRTSDRNSEDATVSDRASDTHEATIEEQAEVAVDFITGLLEALGLEGSVETQIDDDILRVNVVGDQTEALVGRKGLIMQSVHEITRTVIQRRTFGAPRMRVDINGYGERRREALRIYTARQAENVLADGGEIMLEPMNAADRKVIHDAVAEIDGVQSFSEGVDPHRAVVIAPVSAD